LSSCGRTPGSGMAPAQCTLTLLLLSTNTGVPQYFGHCCDFTRRQLYAHQTPTADQRASKPPPNSPPRGSMDNCCSFHAHERGLVTCTPASHNPSHAQGTATGHAACSSAVASTAASSRNAC
jgi:hypothetical protein